MCIRDSAMTDDDDEKESEFIATALYISDRLLSESQIYAPWGLISEASTLWSSPIAATNGPEDLLKGPNIIIIIWEGSKSHKPAVTIVH